MHYELKKIRPISDIARDLRAFCEEQGITQEFLAKACNLNQSQVSRLLDGKSKRLTKGMHSLCIYASIPMHLDGNYDPASDARLMGALRAAVQSSVARARQIERLMFILAES
ncbi:helix-turn-helix transcriptional regulator [Undibacterium sp. FT79W]|uniref:helix-turn-helix domain-containing protein n=1 Tax=Undibacterium sp. FT79W TaxID=2762296 RepID=UPI00164CAFAE|nr:helix-turn-helix transcriptional regulator [Undibacterium sp. FT79W]MBC3877401.1 helix-turn-helix transcriptional regulator [Undibacterium sp. FT79W]